nr:aryl hydrocarbon receptor nuclear translocator homolog [Cavia porcellus]
MRRAGEAAAGGLLPGNKSRRRQTSPTPEGAAAVAAVGGRGEGVQRGHQSAVTKGRVRRPSTESRHPLSPPGNEAGLFATLLRPPPRFPTRASWQRPARQPFPPRLPDRSKRLSCSRQAKPPGPAGHGSGPNREGLEALSANKEHLR